MKEKIGGYKSEVQQKNIAWFLPRPKLDRYKGGMPRYAEEWLLNLARDVLGKQDIKILSLFCGMAIQGIRVDIKPEVKPDFLCDAHEVSNVLIKHKFDVIIADPPYSNEESMELYGTGKINYKRWTSECEKLLVEGGLLIVYHKYVMPNPDPDKFVVAKRVFIGNRTYHLPRVAIYFKKKKVKEEKPESPIISDLRKQLAEAEEKEKVK